MLEFAELATSAGGRPLFTFSSDHILIVCSPAGCTSCAARFWSVHRHIHHFEPPREESGYYGTYGIYLRPTDELTMSRLEPRRGGPLVKSWVRILPPIRPNSAGRLPSSSSMMQIWIARSMARRSPLSLRPVRRAYQERALSFSREFVKNSWRNSWRRSRASDGEWEIVSPLF